MSSHPFSKLAALRDALPAGEPEAPPSAPAEPKVKGPTRAVLRYERKGRGGKEVTLIEQLALAAPELEAWCRDARKALGCGGSVEGGRIVLSGDQRARLTAWLASRGITQLRGG